MILDNKEIIFVHIPKTGGSSLSKIFKKETSDKVVERNDNFIWVINDKFEKLGKNKYNYKHATCLEIKELYPKKFKNYYKFCIIRNTYDRILSLHLWSNDNNFNKKKLIGDIKKNTFNKTINKEKFDSRPWWNATEYILDKNDNLLVDKIINFENLYEDYDLLKNKYNLEGLIHINKTKHQHYSHYYDSELISVVNKYYNKELNYFGFKIKK